MIWEAKFKIICMEMCVGWEIAYTLCLLGGLLPLQSVEAVGYITYFSKHCQVLWLNLSRFLLGRFMFLLAHGFWLVLYLDA